MVLQGLQALKAEIAEVVVLVLDQVCAARTCRSMPHDANQAVCCVLPGNSHLAGCKNSLSAS